MRILITGGINTGKSLLAEELSKALDIPYRLTDELLSLYRDRQDWAAFNREVMGWFLYPPPWIIAGVRVPYALAQWSKDRPGEQPADLAYYLKLPLAPQTEEQRRFSRGLHTMWLKVERLVPDVRYRDYDPRLVSELAQEVR